MLQLCLALPQSRLGLWELQPKVPPTRPESGFHSEWLQQRKPKITFQEDFLSEGDVSAKIFRKTLFFCSLDTQIPLCYCLSCLGGDSDHWKRQSLAAQGHVAWRRPAVSIKAERSKAPGVAWCSSCAVARGNVKGNLWHIYIIGDVRVAILSQTICQFGPVLRLWPQS